MAKSCFPQCSAPNTIQMFIDWLAAFRPEYVTVKVRSAVLFRLRQRGSYNG